MEPDDRHAIQHLIRPGNNFAGEQDRWLSSLALPDVIRRTPQRTAPGGTGKGHDETDQRGVSCTEYRSVM
jgi:hypothetical protein